MVILFLSVQNYYSYDALSLYFVESFLSPCRHKSFSCVLSCMKYIVHAHHMLIIFNIFVPQWNKLKFMFLLKSKFKVCVYIFSAHLWLYIACQKIVNIYTVSVFLISGWKVRGCSCL